MVGKSSLHDDSSSRSFKWCEPKGLAIWCQQVCRVAKQADSQVLFSTPSVRYIVHVHVASYVSLLIKHEIELPLQGYQISRDQSLKWLVKISVM